MAHEPIKNIYCSSNPEEDTSVNTESKACNIGKNRFNFLNSNTVQDQPNDTKVGISPLSLQGA